MNNNAFLCSSCSSVICSDCKEIAGEYVELLYKKNQALMAYERRIEELTAELAREKRIREGFEKISKIGLPELITKWIDSQLEEKPEGEGRLSRTKIFELLADLYKSDETLSAGVPWLRMASSGAEAISRALKEEK